MIGPVPVKQPWRIGVNNYMIPQPKMMNETKHIKSNRAHIYGLYSIQKSSCWREQTTRVWILQRIIVLLNNNSAK